MLKGVFFGLNAMEKEDMRESKSNV